MSDQNIIILGSGMAGLGAAHHFHGAGISTRMYDKNDYPGGHTATFVHDSGFIFDDGPHISFSKDGRFQELFSDNVDGKFEKLNAYVNNYYHGAWVKHPAQANLHNLPDELKTQCILDFIEASKKDVVEKPANYLEWLISVFGETFATNFPAVYGKKYHTVDADQMSTVWMGPRLYRPSMEEVIRGAVFAETPDVHYISDFRYPTEGGFISYLKPFMEKTDMRLEHEVIAIDPDARTVEFANGVVETYDHLVSSIPLPALLPMVKGAPDHVREAAAKLACTTCITVNVGLARDDFTPATWTYIYDEDICFTRLSFPHKMSHKTCPPGCGSIQAECYYSDKYRPLDVSPDDLIQPVIDDLVKIGLIREDEEILHTDARLIPHANIIFDLDRETALPIVHEWLASVDINYVGRFGEWGYQWTDEAFKSGERGARQVIEKM
ncbi:FAD-dependent oxidoreductase [Aliiroseovarius sp. S1339]|uniref:protoporphyrinogen/coproporphyrinogen oxidase n=1 Tax=Aliiroseovarius sp. S1339 TaxID=2936990 RepID=UPI0020C0238E|nr:FAD-dependent oxidoreductase [Aliiroseovarius sp. S1339]MCK8465076.1 FAD-dependent oxidoreductase [Aliiroseovarius sp. S1339]